jgi:Icc protein
LSALLAEYTQAPVSAMPGNHDAREPMPRAFGERIRLADAVELGAWKVYLLDSTVPGETPGLLARDALERLETGLQDRPTTPSLVALHHHPVPVGSAWLDRLGLRNGGDLHALLRRHPQVKAVCFGHVHQEFLQRTDDILYLGTPSTCIQFRAGSPDFAVDNLPPAYRVVYLHENGDFDTHIEYAPANP